MSSTSPRRSRGAAPVLASLGVLLSALACRAPAELDPVAALPSIPRIERESQRPTLLVTIDEAASSNALPDDLMARGGGADRRPIDQLRRTLELAVRSTGRFEPVDDEGAADYRLAFSVRELTAEDPKDLGWIAWLNWKFFGRYLVATARLGGAVYDGPSGEQIGPDFEQRGQYRLLEGKAFRSQADPYLDLLGMGASFAKTGSPARSNALQKACWKLIHATAEATTEVRGPGQARTKDADE